MIKNLPHILFRKKTLAVVGVLVVLMVGVGIRKRSPSEEDREKIDIAERLLNENSDMLSWNITETKITKYEDDMFLVEGIAIVKMGSMLSDPTRFSVEIKKKDSEWILGDITAPVPDSLWDRIKQYVTSFLP